MRKFLILLILVSGLTLRAASFRTLPDSLNGSMMVYSFEPSESSVSVADTLKPVYVSYVARHGARYLSSAKKAESLQKALYESALAGTLTKTGERFHSLLARVIKITDGRWGALSDVGEMEQTRLAEIMRSDFPELLKNGEIEAAATYVPRVVMSMYEFCHSLAATEPDLEVYTSEGKQNSEFLRFFETDSIYKEYRENGEWKEAYKLYFEKTVPVGPAERILGKDSGLDDSQLKDFSMNMYEVMQGLPAMGLPGATTEFMSEEEYEACWKTSNLEHYLRNTITTFSTSAGIAAGNLLKRLLLTADDIIGYHDRQRLRASLYFGHAETLMPLFSLMNLPGCFALPLDLDTLCDEWRDYDIVPLGANLLLAFYESPCGEIYTTVSLNGNRIAPMGNGEMVVRWNVLRDYWMERLELLN